MNGTQFEDVAKAICRAEGLKYVRFVAAGAFKETFLVLDQANEQALKVHKPGVPGERTQREIAAIQNCDHQNIGKLYSVADMDLAGQRYLYSREEFISGGTLQDRVAGGLLNPSDAKKLGTSLISALSHIASRALVHRDLKPENILLRQDGSPVIVDFGLVRVLDESSLTQTWAPRGPGTPFYSSPEQLNNEKHIIDWRSDQFSLGVVLSLSVTGKHPFMRQGDSVHQVVERVARRERPDGAFSNELGNKGMGILLRMLEPWPVRRFRLPRMLEDEWLKI